MASAPSISAHGLTSRSPPSPARSRHTTHHDLNHGDSEGSRSRHCLGSDEADRRAEAKDASISLSSSSEQASQSIAPFLQRHIPQQYDPLGRASQSSQTDGSSTKFCYRHRPDLKCRRQADEPSMDQLQNVSIFTCSSHPPLRAVMILGGSPQV